MALWNSTLPLNSTQGPHWQKAAATQTDASDHAMNMSMASINDQSQEQFDQARSLINNLLLGKVQAVRSTHIALGSVSFAMALIMILRVSRDTRKTAALRVPLRPRKFEILRSVHSAEVFPVILAVSVVVQQIIFVAVQSAALHSVLISGCAGISQVVFPAIFLPGFVTFVFAAETTIRSLKARRFQPRSKWSVPVCIAAILALLLFTWIPTAVWRTANRCFGDLVFFPFRFHTVAISIIAFLLFNYLLTSLIITLQLLKSVRVEDTERVGASLVVYMIGLSSILYIFILPFFIQALLRTNDASFTSGRVADAALFLSGVLFIVGFHLFRTNSSRMTIKAMGVPEKASKKRRFRFFGPSDLPLVISGPVMSPTQYTRYEKDLNAETNMPSEFYGEPELNEPFRFGFGDRKSSSTNRIDPTDWPQPPPLKTPNTNSFIQRVRNTTYSLFPTRVEEIPRLPATVYIPPPVLGRDIATDRGSNAMSVTDVGENYESLQAPQPLFIKKHNRQSTANSRETVQIGLRLSVAPAAIAAGNMTTLNRNIGNPPQRAMPDPPAVLRRELSESSEESLHLPIQSPTADDVLRLPDSPAYSSPVYSPNEPRFSMVTPLPPSPSVYTVRQTAMPFLTPENSAAHLESARNKVLPPIPNPPAGAPPLTANGLRLNPVVTKTLAGSTMSSGTSRKPSIKSPNAVTSPGVRSPGASSFGILSPSVRSPPAIKSPAGWI